MATVTIEVPDELSELVAQAGDRLPELLAQSLREPTLPAHVYRYVLDFLASQPTPEQVAAFGPTAEMKDRLRTLLEREGGARSRRRRGQNLTSTGGSST